MGYSFAPQGQERALSDRYDFSDVRVLLADGNRFMRSTVTLLLRSFGFKHITECSDGAEALEHMRSLTVDIVICDAVMAPLDGLEFTRQVRQSLDSNNTEVPIIMLTGHSEQFRVLKARDAGATEFLCKPMSTETLWKRLVHVVEEPRCFVRAPGFIGPDRRRRPDADYDGAERRSASVLAAASSEEVVAVLGSDQRAAPIAAVMGAAP